MQSTNSEYGSPYIGRMSRHFTLYFTLLFWSYSHTDVACKTDVWAAMRLAHHSDNCNLQINIKSKSVQQFNFYIMIYLHHPKTNIKGLTSHPYPTGSPNGFGFQFGHQGSSVVRTVLQQWCPPAVAVQRDHTWLMSSSWLYKNINCLSLPLYSEKKVQIVVMKSKNALTC